MSSPETRIEMVTGTMIGCGLATMVSALGVGFIGPRLPIVMGVFYIFIGPLVAISKEVSLAAAMTALHDMVRQIFESDTSSARHPCLPIIPPLA